MNTRQRLRQKAEKIAADQMRQHGVKCDRGGCDFHSGHEPCSVDAAWEHYFERALDELNEQEAETA